MTPVRRRRVGKFFYRLTHPRSHHHWYDLRPFLDFERGPEGRWSTVLYKNREVARLSPHREVTRHPRRSVVVVGAGPSLSRQYLERLRERDCILTNGAISLIGSHRVAPLAVFIEDQDFVRAWPELITGIPNGTRCFFTPPVIRTICEVDPSHLVRWQLFLVEILHKPIRAPRPRLDDLLREPFVRGSPDGTALFSTDIERGFGSCGTVVYCACQLALACRPSSLGIAGVDLSNFDQPRFHETDRKPAASRLRRRLPSILAGFGLLGAICRERGIDARNHSSTSILPARDFPYDDWLDADPVVAGQGR
jgi:hypothetical protein